MQKKIKAVLTDGREVTLPVNAQKNKDGSVTAIIEKEALSGVDHIDFEYESELASSGDDGYFVIPGSASTDSALCRFTEREDAEIKITEPVMPVFGVKRKSGSFLAVIRGMAERMTLICGVKGGKYYIFPRFTLGGEPPYEEIKIEYIYLPSGDDDYSAMARAYRNFRLSRGECRPIKEKAACRAALDYARRAPMVRIRLGWKPVPTPVEEQTIETEPEMHVACTFDRALDFLRAMKAEGVEKAEVCLVGWNVKGHDGRWPTTFPVCEELGGESGLKRLIAGANELGYLIDGHTNSTDAYNISPEFDKNDLRMDNFGKPVSNACWSGGRMYDLCPAVASEQAKKTLPAVRELGFSGLHYIDVMSIVAPRDCKNPAHPLTPREGERKNKEIMALSQKLFGGFSSEGGMDFAADLLDYALYVTFSSGKKTPLRDEIIPLWQMVYHGIILNNPRATVVNYPIKTKKERAELFDCGGRPTLYLYSKFVDGAGKNWMGEDDLRCGSEEELAAAAKCAAKAYRDAEKLYPLQSEFIERREEISDGVYKTTYSDGSAVIVDYNSGEVEIVEGKAYKR